MCTVTNFAHPLTLVLYQGCANFVARNGVDSYEKAQDEHFLGWDTSVCGPCPRLTNKLKLELRYVHSKVSGGKLSCLFECILAPSQKS